MTCTTCRDTGHTHISTSPAGDRVFSEYLDCIRCDAASNIAAGLPAIAPPAFVLPPAEAAAELDRTNGVLYSGRNVAMRQGAEALRKLAATELE